MSDEISFETRGPLGLITMTRPKALNALTLAMIRLMRPQLDRWAADPAIEAVAIRGEGDRAFCAGGDVRAIWNAGRDGHFSPGKLGHLAADFFREEYQLNRQIQSYPKPYIALIDGIVMGGGVGVSVHGDIRIAGERTLFAMPETGIGLFPDVGGSFFLPRLPGALGLYMALTGERLKAADCLYNGLATHFVGGDREAAILEALAEADWSQGLAGAEAALAPLSGTPEEAGRLAALRPAIERCFAGKETVEAVLAALEEEDGDWAAAKLKTIASCSPTSTKVAFEQLRRGAALDFDACMVMEYRLSQHAMRAGGDFYEGIRALVVDKDRTPKWNPASLAEVSQSRVNDWFETLGKLDLAT